MIDPTTTEIELKQEMCKYGSVVACFMPKRAAGRNIGHAFVAFNSEATLEKVLLRNNKLCVSYLRLT